MSPVSPAFGLGNRGVSSVFSSRDALQPGSRGKRVMIQSNCLRCIRVGWQHFDAIRKQISPYSTLEMFMLVTTARFRTVVRFIPLSGVFPCGPK